jgi:hypothetical protein
MHINTSIHPHFHPRMIEHQNEKQSYRDLQQNSGVCNKLEPWRNFYIVVVGLQDHFHSRSIMFKV